MVARAASTVPHWRMTRSRAAKTVTRTLAAQCTKMSWSSYAAHDLSELRQVMCREVVVAITDGRLDFGTWERIFYGEFDGRRRKRVLVKIVGE